MRQKLSVEVVLMCVMKWSKEMPPSHRPGNNISVDNIKSEKPSAEIKASMTAIGTALYRKLPVANKAN